ncbi:hypothetical protein CEY15_07405 [Dietzia natronolimnaea]|uniref:DUF485 domain-containing protein n=2 Tax=Dietzia natronolimnaea TaxID=161920 RepID=A0A2A2WR87_9ACTN|nr:hypothetical protein CEY15_07405 [Dietzia natronolimnaea]
MGGSSRRSPEPADFEAMHSSPEFQELRSKFRAFVFPMTIAFLVWYFLYVLLAVYATDFMATKVFGNITWGLIIGLAQFVTTFLYIRFANRVVDPRAEAIRHELEGEVA